MSMYKLLSKQRTTCGICHEGTERRYFIRAYGGTNVTQRYNNELLRICHRAVELTMDIFSFSENARRVSSLFRDRLTTPADSVVYWTKYLIQHGAEANIRPLSADASWTSYFMMDMCAALVVTIFVLRCCARAVRVTLSKFKQPTKNPEPRR